MATHTTDNLPFGLGFMYCLLRRMSSINTITMAGENVWNMYIYMFFFFFSKIGPTLVEETSKNLESILCLQKPLKRWIFFTFNDIFSFLLALVIKRDTGCIVVIYIFDGTASAMFADVTNIPYIMKNHSFLQQSHIR